MLHGITTVTTARAVFMLLNITPIYLWVTNLIGNKCKHTCGCWISHRQQCRAGACQGLVETLWGRIPMWSLHQPGWHGSVECLVLLLSPNPGFGVLQNHGLCFNQAVALGSEIGTCCRLFVAAVLCGTEEGQQQWFTVKTACSFPVCSRQISTVGLWNPDHVSALGGIVLQSSGLYVEEN